MSIRTQNRRASHGTHQGRAKLNNGANGTRRGSGGIGITFGDIPQTYRIHGVREVLHQSQRRGTAVPQVIQADTPPITRCVIAVDIRAFRSARDCSRVEGHIRTVGDQTIRPETRRRVIVEEISGHSDTIDPIDDCGPSVTRRRVD